MRRPWPRNGGIMTHRRPDDESEHLPPDDEEQEERETEEELPGPHEPSEGGRKP